MIIMMMLMLMVTTMMMTIMIDIDENFHPRLTSIIMRKWMSANFWRLSRFDRRDGISTDDNDEDDETRMFWVRFGFR